MKDLLSNAGFIAIVGSLFGGAGLALLNRWLDRAGNKQTEASLMREELRKEIESLRSQIQSMQVEEIRLETDVDSWKNRYYDLRDENQKVVTELTIVMDKLKNLQPKETKE